MRSKRIDWLLFAVLAGLVGCEASGLRRLNAPPQGPAPATDGGLPELAVKKPYVIMVDNALLSDMVITDIHFVPHTMELNGLGAQRLERYAKLLEHYGGTLHYDTKIEDEDVVDKRMEHVREFLTTAGLDVQDIKVARGISGGTGLPAREAILIVDRARTPDPSAGPGKSPQGAGGVAREISGTHAGGGTQ